MFPQTCLSQFNRDSFVEAVKKNCIFRPESPGSWRAQVAEDEADPEMMQQYLDYKILDPSRTSVHMQPPLLDPHTYRQVGKNANT